MCDDNSAYRHAPEAMNAAFEVQRKTPTPEPIIKTLTVTLLAPLVVQKDVEVKIKQRITFDEFRNVVALEAVDVEVIQDHAQ